MSVRGTGLDALSATLVEHVDEICDRFESAWKKGLRPRIEEYLGVDREPARSVLLRELLAAELDWRERLGEKPSREEYMSRLGAHASLVEDAFEDRAARAEPPGTRLEVGDAPASSASVAGTSSSRRFHILGLHAEGGLGVVYRARDEELHREVALKMIRPEFAGRAASRARFLVEAEINGRLEHPGIVPVYSLGLSENGEPHYAMRMIEGITLKEAIDQSRRNDSRDSGERTLALRRLLDRFRVVCDTLSYAHSRGVLHRDVKPQNIMVGRFGETLLMDWGLARAGGETAEDAKDPVTLGSGTPASTVAGSAIGTPAYMSPEQANGQLDRLGPTTDVYSLGATLYHLLTGRAAFEGGVEDVLEKVRRGEFPRPRAIRADIHPALEAICLKAMALEPEARYATVAELAADVERWLADAPVTVHKDSWAVRVQRWARRNRTLVIASVAALLLTTAALAACVLMWCFSMM